MATQASMIMTSDGLAFVIDNVPYSCTKSHMNYEQIVAKAKAGAFDDIPSLISMRVAVQSAVAEDETTYGRVEVHDDYVTYDGERVGGDIANRILQMTRQGFKISNLLKFMNNLYQNPSRTAVIELYGFLEKSKLPITDDGHFLAYKRVRDDYLSVHDGQTDNSVGTRLFMPRNAVDDNRDNTCSYGFHFCSYDYLKHFSGARTVILKINPKDVVTIPSDYNDAKGRANEYVIFGELDQSKVIDRDLLGEAGSVVTDVTTVPGYVSYDVDVDEELDEYNDSDYVASPPVPDVVVPVANGFTPPAPSALPVTTPTIIGYDIGYREGRYGKMTSAPNFATQADYDEYQAALMEGLSDGRKHAIRKWKAPSKSVYE